MKQGLGCLNATGIVATLVVLVLVGATFIISGGLIFSPGGLNAVSGAVLGGVASHAGLGGNCAACHTAPFSTLTMDQKCLACHADVANQMAASTGLHGKMVTNASAQTCRACHSEHHGPAGSLTNANVSNSDHAALGFSLTAHAKLQDGTAFSCKDCHANGYVAFDLPVCTTCHTQMNATTMQAHVTAYGTQCLACHDGIDTYGKAFDHSTTLFKLTGKHTSLDCYACHKGDLKLADMKSTSAQCVACHQKDDNHKGSFGTDCGACHTTDNWTQATFDHSKSAFQLTGAHVNVACAQCHINNVFKGTPTTCYACHQSKDIHNGSFGQDCGSCHKTDAWADVTFDHSKSAFPLTGAHVTVACTKCHVNNVFKGTATQCVSCHADPAYHAGLFGTDCASCHTTTAWTPASFKLAHTFPINHGRASSCQSCHPTTLSTYTCFSCHDQTQMINRHAEEGITDISNCVHCHASGRGGN